MIQYLTCLSVVNRLMATLKDNFLLLLLPAIFLICYCTAWNWKLINSQKAKGLPKEQCSTANWGLQYKDGSNILLRCSVTAI